MQQVNRFTVHFQTHDLALDVIMQEVALMTEMGTKAQDILLKGEAIPEEMVCQMIQNKINSPEVAHHGMSMQCQ